MKASRRSKLTPPLTSVITDGNLEQSLVWPYGRPGHPAKRRAPGTHRGMRELRYSNNAPKLVRSWPVLWTASSAGTPMQIVSQAPWRKPLAVGPAGSSTPNLSRVIATCAYFSTAPGSLPDCMALTQSVMTVLALDAV